MKELDKFSAAVPSMEVIRDFLDWCEKQNVELAEPTPSGNWLQPRIEGREQMLARYFKIDPKKLEQERRALLEKCR
jgi:hypothetical protein